MMFPVVEPVLVIYVTCALPPTLFPHWKILKCIFIDTHPHQHPRERKEIPSTDRSKKSRRHGGWGRSRRKSQSRQSLLRRRYMKESRLVLLNSLVQIKMQFVPCSAKWIWGRILRGLLPAHLRQWKEEVDVDDGRWVRVKLCPWKEISGVENAQRIHERLNGNRIEFATNAE